MVQYLETAPGLVPADGKPLAAAAGTGAVGHRTALHWLG
jgi:hypothetical protein